MRFSRRSLASILALAAWLPALAAGQDFDDDQEVSLARNRFVQYGIVAGRIVGASAQRGPIMTHNLVNPATGRNERVSIDPTSDLPNVRYEMTSPEEDLSIELVDADQLTVRRVLKQQNCRTIEFLQPQRGPMVLSVRDGSNEPRRVQASDLWQLALAEPELCRRELFPLVELLRPSWHLAAQAMAVEEALLRWSAAERTSDRRQWHAWTKALASPRFADREAAERHLLEAGAAVLPFLEALDQREMDAEQRSRLRDLIAVLDDSSEDNVERVVTWLASEPQPWLDLLGRPDRSTRELAARQLARLVGAPLDFDPAADEPTRAAQLARLRSRLAETPPNAPATAADKN